MQPEALVGRVTDVQPHPENDKLNNKMDIVTISGRTNVANRPTPDQPRYKVGDFAVMLAENTILPEWLMKHLGLWDEKKKQGMLGGKKKNRLRPRAMGIDNKITSEVALCPCWWTAMPPKEMAGATYQEGVLRFTDAMDVEYEAEAPLRMITRQTLADGTVKTFFVNSNISYYPKETIATSDDFSPEGENVAWNLGIEEVYAGEAQ